ncbi:unnamed protein product [Acanthoscelides obtectus]|nr:unnamed protein product [Acanthoscelides obtectus]CAK1660575.1 Non-specific lipid-transfer protein [Acanthoscelides obtectus]
MAGSGSVVSENDFSVTPYLKILQQAMEEDEDGLINSHRAIYGLKIINRDGKTGYWVVNCKQGKGKIEFNGKDKPDVTFIVKDADIKELITGKIPPQKAFFQGKVKIQGNMGLAMKLAELQRTAAKKIEVLRAKL